MDGEERIVSAAVAVVEVDGADEEDEEAFDEAADAGEAMLAIVCCDVAAASSPSRPAAAQCPAAGRSGLNAKRHVCRETRASSASQSERDKPPCYMPECWKEAM